MSREKKNPARFVSDGEMQAIKRGISRELFESFEVVWMTVLRDKFGWGPDRLGRIMEDTHAVGEAMIDERISVESMRVELYDKRGLFVLPPHFIRKPIGSGETYWTAADTALTGGRMYRESELRRLRVDTERDVWQICETIWLYTLQKPGRQDTFGPERLLRAQRYARALGENVAERMVSIQDLRQVLLDEAHIVLQRPIPREKEIEKASAASGGRIKAPFALPTI